MSSEPLALPGELRRDVAEHLQRLRHDLGKYVSLQVRFLGEGAAPEARREALAADLLQTRRSPDGAVDAYTLWAERRPVLVGEAPLPGGDFVDLRQDVDLQRLDGAMAHIRTVIGALRAGAVDDAQLDEAIEAARQVTEACRSLAARARSAAG